MSDSQENEHKDHNHNHNENFIIIVNGRQKEVAKKELSFTEIIALAFDDLPTGQNIIFTVTYRRGKGNKPEGTLVEGEELKIKRGMILNVTATDKS